MPATGEKCSKLQGVGHKRTFLGHFLVSRTISKKIWNLWSKNVLRNALWVLLTNLSNYLCLPLNQIPAVRVQNLEIALKKTTQKWGIMEHN